MNNSSKIFSVSYGIFYVEGAEVYPFGISKMAKDGMVYLMLTLEEATDLFFRCLRSPEEDNPMSELVLSKVARALAEASEDDLRMSA